MSDNNGIPIKQEPISEASSVYEEPASFDLDFTLYGPGSVPEFLVGFDHNDLPIYAPVPGGHDQQQNTRWPLFRALEEQAHKEEEADGQYDLSDVPTQRDDGAVQWEHHYAWPMASRDQTVLYSEPIQRNNHHEYAGYGYPGQWRFDQLNSQAYQNSESLESLPQSFDGLTISPSEHLDALGQRPNLGSVPMEGQTSMGLDPDGPFAAAHDDRRYEDEVIMPGQQQEPDWKSEVLESVEEEDDLDSEYSDGDGEDGDDQDGNNIGTGRLQTLQKSWIPWGPYTQLIPLFNEEGSRVEIAGKATTTKQFGEETVNGHRHHVMYRRNYFRVEGQYWLNTTGKATGRLYVYLDGDMVPVKAVCATVRGAVDGDLAREIEISTFSTKRKRLDQRPLTIPLAPSNAELVFEESTAEDGPDTLGTWLRMQWRRATENNGARRAKHSSNYHIVMRLMVQIRARHSRRQQREAGSSPETELVNIGYCMSGPIQARGRCPKSFERYDPTNVDHKRRRPNKDAPPKGLLAKKFDSKTRIGKAKKQDPKKARQSLRRTTLRRTPTPSTVHTPLSRSLTPSGSQTTVSSSLPHDQVHATRMADFSTAPSDVDALSDDEMGNFQREVVDQFGIAGEDRYQYPAATPMWPSQEEPPRPDENLFNGISAWAPPTGNVRPGAISDMDLNFAWFR